MLPELNNHFPAPPSAEPSDVNAVTPMSLSAFVGQGAVVEAMKVALQATRNTGATYPSSLYVGPPGLGKSQLVQILATELGVPLRETLAQTLESISDLQALLLEAQSHEIVFLDEADSLEEPQQVLLYRALAERKLFLPRGRGSSAARAIPLEDFTLILASNHESRLARPLVDRFKMIGRFEFYQPSEIQQLLYDRAQCLDWTCEQGVLNAISVRSRGTPRIGLRILESAHRVAQSENAGTVTLAHLHRAASIDGIGERGLDRTERAYLTFLHGANGPVRLNVLADRLGLPSRTLASCIEPYLVREGLITRSDDGRSLSTDGLEYVRRIANSH